MVAETKETMTKVFDCVTESVRTAFDAGRKTQDAWFKAIGEAWKHPGDAGNFYANGERVMREWVPFVGKNLEVATHCCDAGMRTGLDVFKAACDATAQPGEADPYNATRQMWDATFEAVRTNFDTFGKAGVRTMENCSAFCDAVLHEETVSKPMSGPPKTAK
jgi:hypothetical protein